jgi:hypothetical protein
MRVQYRGVVDEVPLAGLQGEFQHQPGPLGDFLEAVESQRAGQPRDAARLRVAQAGEAFQAPG